MKFLTGVMMNLASSELGAWILARTLYYFDRAFMTLTRGRSTLSGSASGLPVVVVTATGARTGLPRSQPLLCVRSDKEPTSFALVASNWGQAHNPAWYFNLKANPHAQCSIDGRISEYVCHEAEGAEYEMLWSRAIKAYAGFSAYRQRSGRRIPVMVMTLVLAPNPEPSNQRGEH